MNFPFLKAKERLIRIMGTFDLATGHADTFDELLDSLESELRDVLNYYRQQRAERSKKQEWVGLTDAEGEELMDNYDIASIDYVNAIEAKLKEKNGGDAASDTELRRLGYPL